MNVQSTSDYEIESSIMYNETRSEDNIGEFEGYNASIATTNGTASRLVFWDFSGGYQERKNLDTSTITYQAELKIGLITNWNINPFYRYYDENSKGTNNPDQSTKSNSNGLGVRWLVLPRLFVDLSHNEPVGNLLDFNGKKQKSFLNAIIQWQPSLKSTFQASYSKRFYGNSYGLNIVINNKRLTNELSYKEDIQSFTRNNFVPVDQGDYWCPALDDIILANCVINSDTNLNFDDFQLITINDYDLVEDDILSLNKTVKWHSKLELPRTTFQHSN